MISLVMGFFFSFMLKYTDFATVRSYQHVNKLYREMQSIAQGKTQNVFYIFWTLDELRTVIKNRNATRSPSCNLLSHLRTFLFYLFSFIDQKESVCLPLYTVSLQNQTHQEEKQRKSFSLHFVWPNKIGRLAF